MTDPRMNQTPGSSVILDVRMTALKLPVLAQLLGLALAGLAPSEFMLCVHQDGRAFVEPFQDRCCADPCGTSACPDEQCRDLPLAAERDDLLHDAPPPSLDVPPALLAWAGPSSGIETSSLSGLLPESRALDPPRSPALAHLRTVVLRR